MNTKQIKDVNKMLYRDYKTIEELQAAMEKARIPNEYQFNRLTKQEKIQFQWLHKASIKVLWMTEYVLDGVVGYNSMDMTIKYRYPILQNYHDMREFRSNAKELASFSYFKIEHTTYFIDSVFTDAMNEKLAIAYARGVFKRVDLMDLD